MQVPSLEPPLEEDLVSQIAWRRAGGVMGGDARGSGRVEEGRTRADGGVLRTY